MTIRIGFPAIASFLAAPCKIIVPPIGFAGRSLSIITDSPLSLRRFIASLFSCVSAEIRQNLCAACVLGLHECSNSRPHVCKADFTNFALISLLLFFLLTRCYFIESQHVKTSSASSVVGVVEPSFAPFCPRSMPAEGKVWATFGREILPARQDIRVPVGYRKRNRLAPFANACPYWICEC